MEHHYQPSPAAGPSRSPSLPDNVDIQAVVDEFERYPFTDDPDFKAGLPTVIRAIRGSKRSALQIDEMIGRAQWFYFTRLKNISIPWDVYAAQSSQPRAHQTPSTTPPSTSASSTTSFSSQSRTATPLRPHDALAQLNNLAEAKKMMNAQGGEEEVMSFAMLCRLISEGRAGEVPVRTIPDQLNAQPPSESHMGYRAKPWEQPPQPTPFPYNTSPPSFNVSSGYNSPTSISNLPTARSQTSLHSMHSAHSHHSYHSQSPHSGQLNSSPPGTSASFTNPALAPSPPAHLHPLPSPFTDYPATGPWQSAVPHMTGMPPSNEFSGINLSWGLPYGTGFDQTIMGSEQIDIEQEEEDEEMGTIGRGGKGKGRSL